MVNAIKTCPYCDGRIELKDGQSYCPTQSVFVQSLTKEGYVPPDEVNNNKDSTTKTNASKKTKSITATLKPPAPRSGLGSFRAAHPLSINPSKIAKKNKKADVGEISLSGFMSRFIALAIDFVLLTPVFIYINNNYPSNIAINMQYNSEMGQLTTIEFFNPYNALYFIVATIVYFLVFEVLFSATLGKLLMSERIVTYGGDTPKPLQKILHVCLLPLDIIFGLFTFVVSSKNQLFSDKIARIIVVKKNPNGPSVYGEPVSGFRKFIGFLFFLSLVAFGYFVAQTVPEILKIHDYANVVVKEVKNISETSDVSVFYNLFTEESKSNNSVTELNKAFTAPNMVLLIESLDPSAFTPYFYELSDTQAVIYGVTDTELYIEMTLLKNEASEWKLHIICIYISNQCDMLSI